MTAPVTTVATSDVSSATPLENDVGAMFGDVPVSVGEESPESGSTSAPGTTPGEPTPETATEPSSATEPTGAVATPAPSDGTTPSAAPAVPAEDDPFKDTTPATYVVEGKTIPVEDIRVFKEGGAVIRPEALPNILSKLAERDKLYEQNKSQYGEIQDYGKLVEWRTQGADGKEQILTGRDGAIEMRVSHSKLEAAFDTMVSVFKPDAQGNYKLLSDLVDVDQATGKIIPNQQVLDHLITRADLAERNAADTVNRRLAEITKAPTTSGRSGEQATQLSPEALKAEAPRVIQLVAQQTGTDVKLLTAEDQKFLQDQFPLYVRPVTEAERRDPALRDRSHITDASFSQLVTRQVNLRKEMAATSQATEKATKEGQARMLQAARGLRPTKPQQAPPPRPTPPAEERAASEGELFDTIVRSGSRALRAR